MIVPLSMAYLSIYIETKNHKVLVDTGATSAFIDNAKKLNVPLEKVDTVILSHGHYDHSGGILAFFEINKTAKVYIHKKAGGDYYHGERYIGIDKEILKNQNVQMLDQDYKIDEELSLFTNVVGRKFYPASNLQLSQKINGEEIQDSFEHEQYLVVSAGEERILISGCAHNGILNILERYQEIYPKMPTHVISGFHMTKKTGYTLEETQIICDTARELKKWNTTFHSGHCTGKKAMKLMKDIMGEQLQEIHSGCFLNI